MCNYFEWKIIFRIDNVLFYFFTHQEDPFKNKDPFEGKINGFASDPFAGEDPFKAGLLDYFPYFCMNILLSLLCT